MNFAISAEIMRRVSLCLQYLDFNLKILNRVDCVKSMENKGSQGQLMRMMNCEQKRLFCVVVHGLMLVGVLKVD